MSCAKHRGKRTGPGEANAETFWYDQIEHEWVIVLSGRAKLRYERDETLVELGPGDAAFIPGTHQAPGGLDDAGRAHSVAGTLLDRAVSNDRPVRQPIRRIIQY